MRPEKSSIASSNIPVCGTIQEESNKMDYWGKKTNKETINGSLGVGGVSGFPQARKFSVALKCSCWFVELASKHLQDSDESVRMYGTAEGYGACVEASVLPLRGADFHPPISTGSGASWKRENKKTMTGKRECDLAGYVRKQWKKDRSNH